MPVTEGVISLYDLDLTSRGGPIFHFCSLADLQSVFSRGGVEYTPVPMQATGFEWRSTGAMPQPTVAISNAYGGVNLLLNDYGELLGVPLTRIRTLFRWMDQGSDPDPAAEIGRDLFVIAQKSSHTMAVVAFKLSWKADQEGTTLPRRVLLRDICGHVYRRWTGAGFDYSIASCPYAGAAMFTVGDQPTTNGASDQCSRRLSGCKKRFPGQPLPSRAYPALGRVR